MPGTVIIKPIKANLLNDNHHFLKMDPYCSISVGHQEVSGKVCKNGGKEPEWQDQLIFRRTYEPYCTLQIKDKEFFKTDATVGITQIDLREIEQQGRISKWYKLGTPDNQPAGEVLIEGIFAADSAGSYKQLPQQQSYAYVASSHKNYTQSLYPPTIYSPGKRSSLGLDRPVYQVPETVIPGYHNRDQLITYPHISHNLSREEYGKMHARNVERYQPMNRVVPEQQRPPTWEGYRIPEHLLPQEPPKSSEVEIKEETEPEVISKEAEKEVKKEVAILDDLENKSLSDKNNTSIEKKEKIQEVQKTPVNKRRELEEIQQSPGGLNFYPMIAGVHYRPQNNEAKYKPVYEWPSKKVAVSQEAEKENVKAQRKLSANTASTGEKSGNNSTMGSLGALGGSTVNTLDVI